MTSNFGGDCCIHKATKTIPRFVTTSGIFFLSCVTVRATDLSNGTAAALYVRTSSPVACWHCLNETEEAVGWSKLEMGKEGGARRAE